MLEWFIKASRLVRETRRKALDALRLYDEDSSAAELAKEYLKAEYDNLTSHWKARFSAEELGGLGRHIAFGKTKHGGKHDYWDILCHDLPAIEKRLEAHLLEAKGPLYPETVVD